MPDDFWPAAAMWTARSLIAGGTALLVTWLIARRVADAARRQRVLAWSVQAAVLACGLTLLPAWLAVPVPGWQTAAEDAPKPDLTVAVVTAPPEVVVEEPQEFGWLPIEAPADVSMEVAAELPPPAVEPPPAAAAVEPAAPPEDTLAAVARVVLIPYWIGVAAVLVRQLIGYIGLARLRRAARPADDDVQALAAELCDGPAPRVLVSDRVGTPVCFGVFRPTVLLPRVLPMLASPDQLRWVLAHELAHLRRGDPRTGVWAGLAAAVFFPLPWFWAVRRELNLAQEYLADAAAAGAREADYAAFLVDLSSRPGVPRSVRAVPSLAGVRAGRSDLYRRVTMLLTPKSKQSRWGRAWSALALSSAVTAAVAISGVRLTADEPKKTDKVTDEKRIEIREDKPRDGEPEVRRVEVRVFDGGKDTAELEKAIEAAAKKGDVEAVKGLVAKLKAAQGVKVTGPATLVEKGQRVEGRIVEGQPLKVRLTEVKEDVPHAVRVRTAVALDEETQKLEKAIEKLKQAAEEVKDQPEAKAALEKSIAEYRKKIAEAKKNGELRAEAGRKVENLPADKLFRFAPTGVPAEKVKASIDEMMKVYEKQLAALANDPKAADALKESMKAYKASMEQLTKQLAQGQWQGQMQAQGFMPVQPLQPLQPMTFNLAHGADVYARKVPASGRLGVMVEGVPAVTAEQLDLPAGKGVVVLSVVGDSPAAKSGLKAFDILLEVGGKQVTADDLSKTVGGLKAGETFDVLIVRKGKKETLKGVTIPTEPKATTIKKGESTSSSMSVSLNGDQFEIDAKQGGTKYTLKGTVGDNDSLAVTIKAGDDKTHEYKGMKNVPGEYREKVEKLLKSVSK